MGSLVKHGRETCILSLILLAKFDQQNRLSLLNFNVNNTLATSSGMGAQLVENAANIDAPKNLKVL